MSVRQWAVDLAEVVGRVHPEEHPSGDALRLPGLSPSTPDLPTQAQIRSALNPLSLTIFSLRVLCYTDRTQLASTKTFYSRPPGESLRKSPRAGM